MRGWYLLASILLLSPAGGAAQGEPPKSGGGIEVSEYPQMVAVAGSPVYYDPSSSSNYFFYDGMFWIYRADTWYAGSWFNGPWAPVAPLSVPVFVLRIPVRYFRDLPSSFLGWKAGEPPRWGDIWGAAWEAQRKGWNRWERTSVPRPAPLPVYQKQYSGNRYPAAELQATLQDRNYPYRPQEVSR